MAQIYCGNNALDPQLISGNSVLGTRYSCMRKGVGFGLHLPYDQTYTGAYDPIDQRRIYCGNKALPAGYDRFGNLPHCFQKGVGIGKLQRARQGHPAIPPAIPPSLSSRFTSDKIINRPISPIFIFLLIIIGLFIYMYFVKPSIVTNIDNNNIKHIDWRKFVGVYMSLSSIIGVFIILWRV